MRGGFTSVGSTPRRSLNCRPPSSGPIGQSRAQLLAMRMKALSDPTRLRLLRHILRACGYFTVLPTLSATSRAVCLAEGPTPVIVADPGPTQSP